ncbi:hypothetical protein PV08_05781 [Exophiala spinifera]|uniref:Zn(2)-C6 fungal-type domain-containing protein n=1 Tax=Exophiala spinifera TaxID=91928 RepID=A0A0D1YL13_9EURO|nr:uncharacterized protein PV08_05781 [Exophiala spinifera]KIW15731.1 hypothetical protein PV08_05781 [Exophiala spinifera]
MAESVEDNAAATTTPESLLPCDACRKRKVKCSKTEPCERCVSAGLRCTRDIARKKRGPKKGSGSVIAKLRDESQQHAQQDGTLPPFDFSQMQMQIPALNRTWSHDSPLGSQLNSPLSSPSNSHFGDVFAATPDPHNAPRSVPTTLQNGTAFEPASHTAFTQVGIQFPASWQVQPSELLQFQAPMSPSGYMTVSDLAQQIFPETFIPEEAVQQHTHSSQSQHSPSRTSTPLTKLTSFEAMMTNANGASSPATTASSPMPSLGPRFLYRSDSHSSPIEPQIQQLANEFGLSALLMSQCIRQYFRHLYSIRPIIHEKSLLARLRSIETLNLEEKVLILSLCATTVLHAAPQSELPLEKKHSLGLQFVQLCLHLRQSTGPDWAENTTLLSIQASYHIAVALFELQRPKAHAFYLREAIGMALDQGLHHESTYASLPDVTAICSRRTIALLFITERGLAILRNKPTQITRLPSLPTEYFDETDAVVLAGFTALVNLFSILDEKFVRLWSGSGDTEAEREPLENIAGLQRALNEMSFSSFSMTDVQKADVLITHQWLRLIFWQASMRQGLISFASRDPIFSSRYPITIAQDLCACLGLDEADTDGAYDAILVHGMGIFEKLFEVAYTLMDMLTLANRQWSESRELRCLFNVLSASTNSQSTYVKMLRTKIENERSPAQSPTLS